MNKMIEEFQYKGMWWLPHEPEEQIPGTFKFTPIEGAVLELIGSFKMFEPEIILGISSDGEKITLYKCFVTNSILRYPGLPTSSFYVNIAFVGAHFQKTEDIKFKSLSIHYLYLDEWFNVSRFDIQQFDEKEIVIRYKPPKPIQVAIDDYKILLKVKVIPAETHSIMQKEASIKKMTYITIEPSEKKSFDEYLNIMHYIQNFLSLGVTKPVYPLIIEGKTEMDKEMINDTVKVYHRVSYVPTKIPRTLIPQDMLFTFEDISDRFEFFFEELV
jgi:hypothetical protein